MRLIPDKRLAQKFDKLRSAAKDCQKGDRTHKRYERTVLNVKQALVKEFNQVDAKINSWEQEYLTTHNCHPNPEDIPSDIATAMRKRKKISTITYHEWKLKVG